ncbi:MAG: TonB-dependent receptor [Candidatus Acidiferrales bacterium]
MGKIGWISSAFELCAVLFLAVALGFSAAPASAQGGTSGTVAITVLDPDGSVVPNAQLKIESSSTSDVRQATTLEHGTYSFVNLPIGNYKLTVSRSGFRSQVFDTVTVQAAQVTDVVVNLNIGVATETVEVKESATPLIDTTSSAIGTVVDMKQLEQLPITGRDVSQLAFIVPGYTGSGTGGTWNGLPSIAQGNNIDGVIASTSRMKFGGNTVPEVQARLEDMQEMTVQTDQLDLDQGFGASNMQVSFITRAGTNQFHGRIYEDFRNAYLNANTWVNDASATPKGQFELNDFGGSVGGPIIHDKLFFFGGFATARQPGTAAAQNNVFTAAAQNGNFTFTGTDNAVHTVNLLTQIAGPAGLPSTVNSVIAQEQSAINSAVSSSTLTTTGDPNLQTVTFLASAATTSYFPTVRVDYNLSQAIRMNFSWNMTKTTLGPVLAFAPPFFPGSAFADQGGNTAIKNYTASYGLDWTLSPTLVNQFRGGFLYNSSKYVQGATTAYATDSEAAINWGYPSANGNMSGQTFNLPTSTYYPIFNASDSMTWQHGAHNFKFGFSWFHEQDHYWNNPGGVYNIYLGLATGDPALNAIENSPFMATAGSTALTEAEQLYAILAGRVGSNSGNAVHGQYAYLPTTGNYAGPNSDPTASYNLNELQRSWGVFFQDSFKLKPNLTFNYGLRWDFTGDDHDKTNAYHSVTPTGIWGPSGIGNSFMPGVLSGDQNPELITSGHQYNPWNISPQPSVGLAWSPGYRDGLLGKLSSGNTVVRAGFSLRDFTEPYQYFWNAGSNYGALFYQTFYLNSNTTGAPGTFTPGSVSLQDNKHDYLPATAQIPTSYPSTFPESGLTFINPFQQVANIGLAGINPSIKQPYTMSWNLGIQRQIGRGNAIEVRYVGSRTNHQWINQYTNEVNIFENGFLPQFQAAQANLAINQAHGVASFANNGYAGQAPTPIFDAAFAGLPSSIGYQNGAFIPLLQQGQAGALATQLTGGDGGTYLCNLVTTGFAPCAPGGTANYSGSGGPYPINFFQANPFISGQDVGFTNSTGYSNYHSLQVDFRQKQWHGMQFDVNYTWSHTLGLASQNQWTAQYNAFSIRDPHLSYGPTLFDVRQAVNANGTYDLPFGLGKHFADRGGIVDKVVGHWTLGTIVSYHTGLPFQLTTGYLTVNDYGDAGVDLHGVTVSQLQSSIGVYRVPGSPYVNMINPKYLLNGVQGGGANTAYISPHQTPGTFGAEPFLYGPHFFNTDLSITKVVPITEKLRFTFQGEFLNAFNHPNFGPGSFASNYPFSPNVTASNFMSAVPVTTANNIQSRQIELRAAFEF